jgi:large subunit ribosomal protein L18
MLSQKKIAEKKRIKRIRAKISGSSQRPRLSIFKSLKHIYASLIDDQTSVTILAVSDFDLKNEKNIKRTEKASRIGQTLAEKALKLKIKKVVFDKRGYKYHGVIKALASGARKGGLEF